MVLLYYFQKRIDSQVSDTSESSPLSPVSSLIDLREICQREQNKIKGAAEGE